MLMASADQLLRSVDEVISDGVRRGMLHNVAEDDRLDGRNLTIGGRRMVNFGSCSYLGLETHPAMRIAVHHAVDRYGTQFSSSRAYVSAPGYTEVERLLSELFGRPAFITASTTMGHIAAMPTLIGAKDALLLDQQVHNSVQTAAKLVRVQGSTVEMISHSDISLLEERIRELSCGHDKIWYAADGLYSMYADFMPARQLNELCARFEQLWLYIDDAHAVSWLGKQGRGFALDQLSPESLRKTVVAGSLNKSFAASGGVLTFPDEETARRVFTVGGPMVFSGPVQPPMLAAIRASAELHLLDQVGLQREQLMSNIRLFNKRAREAGLPLLSNSEAPIRCVGAGVPDIAYDLTAKLREAGYFADTATFPAVAAKRSGVRITLTAHHRPPDINGIVDCLAKSFPEVLADHGSSFNELRYTFRRQLCPAGSVEAANGYTSRRMAPLISRESSLRLERHTSTKTLPRAQWDHLFGKRGSFDVNGLELLEEVFTGNSTTPENNWDFSYWIVRREDESIAAATFLTKALWKDDMLASPGASADIEKHRSNDHYFLTSITVGTGSLITEGEHLYLDRSSADWTDALRLLIREIRNEYLGTEMNSLVLRDFDTGDEEIRDLLVGEGFVRVDMPNSWHRRVDFDTDEKFLAGLPKKARYHQRSRVLAWEAAYSVDVVRDEHDYRRLSLGELDQLYGLYRNVQERKLELNVFPLPRSILDAVACRPGWELLIMRLRNAAHPQPVAFVAQHIGANHIQPVFIGLDYDYVESHNAYQQTLWQVFRSAQRLGKGEVLLGMSADLQKKRFGASLSQRSAYVQLEDDYAVQLITHVEEGLPHSGA
jgi:7-keto-8-aminopelargonate synthetase-like enzyme